MYIIAGLFRNRRLAAPKSSKTRPTAGQLRESLFNICQNYIEETRFLDLFAGSGAVGLEALSRGAHSATFIDNSKEAIRCIQQNVAALGVENQSQVLYGHIFQMLAWLEQHQQQFDIIYADPPYHIASEKPTVPLSEKVIRFIDQSTLLAPGGTLFIEEALEFQPQLSDLSHLKLKNSRRMGRAALQQYLLS
jgi:16S rRNA (guanine966-N2)-methyltransferase